MKLSVVILTKNEEKNINKALDSVRFCDQIIIVDDYSEDKTVEIAKKVDVEVYQRKLNGNFSSQRNFGLDKSRGEWVLFIDADEEVSLELANEIKNAVKNNKFAAYYIKRRDFWWGRELKYGEVANVRDQGLIRLVKRESGKWVGNVHEEFKTVGSIGRLNSFLNHYPHQSLKEFIADINFYSTLRARELQKQGKRASLFELIAYPLGKFLENYLVRGGFLDGPAGFAYAFLMSFHSYLVRAKLYQYLEID